jgi:aspartyl-tRNA(Asn)/glutamyl-tRNA(Gln) amidotransferase subunit A
MSESSDKIGFASIAELGELLRRGEITATTLAECFLERLDSVGRQLNSVASTTRDLALSEAARADAELAAGHDRGPLHGIPYGAKDLLATAGIPTTWGAAPFRNQVLDRDAAVVERLREAGAVLVAKLAMVELAGGFGYDQPDAAWTGPGLNPWNLEAWAGGSSSGSGAAVAAGCVPFAIGSETFGSITVPASFCGISGLRPTFGLVSRRGAMALSWTMDKLGPMARSAEDCAAILAAIAGHDPHDPSSIPAPPDRPRPDRRFRLAALRDATAHAQPEVRDNYEASLKTLADFADLDEISLPDYPYGEIGEQVIVAEGAAAFEEFIASGAARGLTAPEDRVGLADGLTMPAVDYIRALRLRQKAAPEVDRALAPFDAVVAPTTRFVATPITARFTEYFGVQDAPSLSGAGNILGLPSISVPNGYGERGLPTGLEIMGRAWSDQTILAVATAFQERSDWHRRRPEVG